MNDLAVVLPYFGKFKPSSILFFESVGRNPNVDYLIFTDNECNFPQYGNIKWFKMNIKEFAYMASEKLQTRIVLTKPYKLCDYKPLYGAIFEDYLKSYKYWGYGDYDVIYGRIDNFIDVFECCKFDKINRMGHFTFLKNNQDCVWAFANSITETKDWRDVIKDPDRNYGFDERDFNYKCDALGLNTYEGDWAADIDIFYRRMRCVELSTFRHLAGFRNIKSAPRNYKYQLFVLEDGRIIRYFLCNDKVKKDEFAYIHYRYDRPIYVSDLKTDSLIIATDGFYDFDTKINDKEKLTGLIERYNNVKEYGLIEALRFARGFSHRIAERGLH